MTNHKIYSLILIDQILFGLSVQQRQTGLLEIKYIACMFQFNFWDYW